MPWGAITPPNPRSKAPFAAARSLDVKVILVGVEDVLRKELARHPEAADLPIESPSRQ